MTITDGHTDIRNYGAAELRSSKAVAREMGGSKQALGRLMEQLRSSLEYGYSMGRVWVEHLSVRRERTLGTSGANCESIGDVLRTLRYVAMIVMMMVVGASEMWGLTEDYSGTYYLANDNLKNNIYDYKGYDDANNFYLCPAKEYYYGTTTYTPDNEQPFLTTNKTRQTDESLWIVEKVTKEGYTNYYTIKQKVGDKFWFITVNNNITGIGNKTHRRRVHLEKLESNELTDRNYFTIELITTIDGMRGYTIGCVDEYKNGDNKYLNPAGGNYAQYTANGSDHGGIVGFYKKGAIGTDASGSIWFFEVPKPIINIDEHFKLTFTCANANVTYHYTIDGGDPSATGTDDRYTEEIQLTEGVHTIKAIAVMNSGNIGYASGVTTYIVRILNTTSSYLIQNLECTDFYMMPGDVDKGNTTVNTSSLFRSTMEWTFSYAGSENGFLYYYIINGSTGDYLYTNTNNGAVYMKTSTVFNDAEDKTDYMFSIEQGYSDAEKNNPNGFHIVPKAKISDNTYCIYKGGWGNNTTPPTLANSKAEVMKGSNNARRPEQKHTRWNIIVYSAPGNVLSSSLVTSDDNNPILFKIENAGTQGQYMNDASPVGTATTGSNELAWYIKEASSESERKYYYIVHKKTGKYLKFNQTIASPQSSMQQKNNVLSLLAYDNAASDRYQFVFAKSTIDGAYYIVPKGLEDATYSKYYALYLDGTNPIKSNKNRSSDDYNYKWKLVPFCANPVFAESEGNITLSCATTGAEIHYTDNEAEPDENSTLYVSDNWNSSDPVRIKAIAVIKDGSGGVVSTSEIITLLNKPTVTLEAGPFVYNGTTWEPSVTVSIDETTAPISPATYIVTYNNNIKAGVNTASVTITDIDPSENDKWYILNVPSTPFTIEKATLTATADNKTVEYGSAAPTYYSISYSGWVNGETLQVLETIPTATCDTYTPTSPVGVPHEIVPSGGVDDNYDIIYVNGTLTVAAAFVTLTANSGTETYDGTEKTVTGFTSSVNGLAFPGVNASGSGTDAGTYDVTFMGVTLNATTDESGDYVVTNIVDGTLTINPAEATVTADNKTKTYGESDPELTATVTGLIGSDAITYSLNRATGDNAGTYAITPMGEAAQGNYTVNYVPGTFTISQKGLTITAPNQTITYGEAPNNDVTYDGFITGESENTEGVFTGTLVYSYNSQADGQGTSYTTTIPAGTSYIIPSGLIATNYAITYVAGTLTVGPKSIGNGSIASDFTLSFGDGGAIILKDGETTLEQTTDYTIGDETTSASGRYSEKTISGTGNYKDSFSIRNTIVNFQTDDDRVEWSATFVAEDAAGIEHNNSDVGHKLPDGVRAYIITDIIGEWAIPEPLNYIPEGVPVLLVSDKESGGFLVEDADQESVTSITSDQKDANMLEEVTALTPGYISDSGNANYEKAYFSLRSIYLLSKNEFVHNMPGYLAKGSVYLNPNHSSGGGGGGSRLFIMWDVETGIEDAQLSPLNSQPSAEWYTLDGRLISGKPTRKGIYIVNGKKVIIR